MDQNFSAHDLAEDSLEDMISRQHVNVPSINDPNSGFQLVTSFVDELAEISSLYSESNYQKHQEISGSIQFAVWYRNDEQILYVKIVGASNLAAEMGKTLNPYVKVHLLPHKSKHTKRKTGIQRKTTNPEFNETVKVSSKHSAGNTCRDRECSYARL